RTAPRLLAAGEVCSGPWLRAGRSDEGRKFAVVRRSRCFRKPRVEAGEGLRSRRYSEHDPRNRDVANRKVEWSMAADGKDALRKSRGHVCRRRDLRCDWLGVERVLPDQQSVMDQLIRALHRRTRLAVPFDLLLADRH